MTQVDGRRLFITSALVVLTWIGTSGRAQGTPIFFSQVMTRAGVACATGECSETVDTGVLNGQDSVGSQTTTKSGSGGATATAFGSVVDGVLHASASGTGGTGFFDGWNAITQVLYHDTLKLESTSLSVGTPVQLAISMDLDYSLSAICDPTGVAVTSRSWVNAQLATQAQGFRIYDDCGTSTDVNDSSGVVQAFIGQEFQFQAFLETNAFGTGQASGFADAANTFRIVVNPLGDFSYISASGNSYLTSPTGPAPVPEPGTVSLLGLGLAGLIHRLRRSRQRLP